MSFIPQLPTDNLYKFIALSGITLMIAFVVASLSLSKEVRLQEVAVKTDRHILRLQLRELRERSKQLAVKTALQRVHLQLRWLQRKSKLVGKPDLQSLRSQFRQRQRKSKQFEREWERSHQEEFAHAFPIWLRDQKDNVDFLLEKLRRHTALQADLDALELEEARVDKRDKQLEVIGSEARLLYWVTIFFACVGVLMAIVGFWLWYVRVQKYLDERVKKEAA